jgi:hypothetical protein
VRAKHLRDTLARLIPIRRLEQDVPLQWNTACSHERIGATSLGCTVQASPGAKHVPMITELYTIMRALARPEPRQP